MTDNEKTNPISSTELDGVSGGVQEPMYDDYFTHYVSYGQTLSGICLYYGAPLDYIANLNNLVYPYILRVGQGLLIPKSYRK